MIQVRSTQTFLDGPSALPWGEVRIGTGHITLPPRTTPIWKVGMTTGGIDVVRTVDQSRTITRLCPTASIQRSTLTPNLITLGRTITLMNIKEEILFRVRTGGGGQVMDVVLNKPAIRGTVVTPQSHGMGKSGTTMLRITHVEVVSP